jgi:predicted dehydrogenase
MTNGDTIRVGVLGTGAVAQVVHLPLLNQLPRVKTTAVCDADRSKATAIAKRFGIGRVARTDDEIVESDDVDAVLICTPSHLHESQAIAALQAGKHVLVEKPLALTAVGAEKVIKAAERSGTALMAAMNNRFRQDAQALKPFARGGELGDIFMVKAGWLNRKMRLSRLTWRHKRATAGGGALMDLGVQILDLTFWMLEYPKVARLVAYTPPAARMEVEDSAAVLLETEDGVAISLEVTWALLAERDQHYLQILGSAGTASLSPLAVHKEMEQGLVDVTPPMAPGRANQYTASYRAQLNHFLDVCRGARDIELPRDQIELMRWIELAYRSAAREKEVKA